MGVEQVHAVVERQGDTITWKAFGYENTHEDKILVDAYSTVGPFAFDGTAYDLRPAYGALRQRERTRG